MCIAFFVNRTYMNSIDKCQSDEICVYVNWKCRSVTISVVTHEDKFLSDAERAVFVLHVYVIVL